MLVKLKMHKLLKTYFRYKVRREGDLVRLNDSIVLKSVHYKDCFLTVSDHSSSAASENVNENATSSDNHSTPLPYYVGITSDQSKILVSGWSIKIFRRNSNQNNSQDSFPQLNTGQRQDEKQVLFTGSYIKISLVESTGHVICRADDAKLVLSKVAPLGAISRLQSGMFRDISTLKCLLFRSKLTILMLMIFLFDNGRCAYRNTWYLYALPD